MQSQTRTVMHWSTGDLPQGQRVDYWADLLSNTLAPMRIRSFDAKNFGADITVASLGEVSVAAQSGSAHNCYSTEQDLGRRSADTLHLVMSDSSWDLTHRGNQRMQPGDLALVDTRNAYDIKTLSDARYLNVTMTRDWVQHWAPDLNELAGQRVGAVSAWGYALSSYVRQLTPQFIVNAPLPDAVLADQIGALLALTADGMRGATPAAPIRTRPLRERIRDCIAQRCAEPELTAVQVAASIGISPRTLHRAFAAFGETFGQHLLEMRIQVALRMLTARSFSRFTTAEIGRRAGFSDASHFARILRRQTGRTPLQIRREAAFNKSGTRYAQLPPEIEKGEK